MNDFETIIDSIREDFIGNGIWMCCGFARAWFSILLLAWAFQGISIFRKGVSLCERVILLRKSAWEANWNGNLSSGRSPETSCQRLLSNAGPIRFDSLQTRPSPSEFIPKHWFCQRNAKQIENSNFPFDQPRKCTLISWHHSFIALPLHCHPDDSHQYRFGTKQKQNVCLTSPRCVSLVNVNDIGNPSSVSPPII